MPANLTVQDGEVRAAFNVERGHPWHRLGIEVEGDMTIGQALELVGVKNEEVIAKEMYIKEGQFKDEEVEVENRVAIWSDVFGVMGTATPSYEITQRRYILELAYEITGLDKEKGAHLDTVGNIGSYGEVFFAYIRVPDLVIDGNGIADVIERGLFVGTSFDGSLSNAIGYSNIRVVCENTLHMALGYLKQVIGVKHTRNSEDRMRTAAVALGYVGAVEEQVLKNAEKMLRVDGAQAMNRIVKKFWDVDEEGISDRTRERRELEIGSLWELYDGAGNTNRELVGANGYAAYNALTEFVDHHRNVRGAKGGMRRTKDAVLPGKWTKMKVEASKIVLGMTGG